MNRNSQPERGNPQDRPSFRDRILIVENDPAVSDLIGRQALQAVGYQVQIAADATTAIAKALQWAPDLILVDLNLPGLSGKDLLVALASQGVQTPLIIIAARGMEADLIQTFRLGAADYLLLPAREAEVVNAVNRVLQQVHDRSERDRLALQLQQANQDLQARVRELTTIFAFGKAMTSVTDQSVLFDRILDGATRITQADLGWFLLREDIDRPFLVVAEQHLPPALGVRLNQPWEDGISSLVAMSGESLTIQGEPLKRLKIAGLGQAALISPIKAQKNVVGLLVMLRKRAAPFGSSEQHLLDALADYASISLVNARLFRTVEERARSLQYLAESAQVGGKAQNDLLQVVKKELTGSTQTALAALEQLAKDPTARWRPDQRQHLALAQDQLLHVHQVAESIIPNHLPKTSSGKVKIRLNDLIRQSLNRLQTYGQRAGISLVPQIPAEPLMAWGDEVLLSLALEGGISNAIKFSSPGGQVLIRLEKTPDAFAHIMVHNGGRIIDPKEIQKVFQNARSEKETTPGQGTDRFGGLGVRLTLVKDIITWHRGKIWLESQPGKGTDLHFNLPLSS